MYAVTKSLLFLLSLFNIQIDKENRKNIAVPLIIGEDDNLQHLIPQVEQSERDHLDVRVSRIEESVERFVDSKRTLFFISQTFNLSLEKPQCS